MNYKSIKGPGDFDPPEYLTYICEDCENEWHPKELLESCDGEYVYKYSPCCKKPKHLLAKNYY